LTALELVLAPEDAARLPRLKLLAGLRVGRWRRHPVSVVWHDTAEGALANDDLTLAETRATWRLELLVPGRDLWPPGGPAPVVAQAAALDQLDHKLPANLLQMARFEGTQGILRLARDGTPLTVELLHGTVGWGRRRRPACRITLTGEAAAVFALALDLAEQVDLAVPTTSLAAEARAAAIAVPAPPRHRGPPELPAGLTVAVAFSYVLGHLADVILHNAPPAAANRSGPEPVHEMRVAVRRLRSAIALFRPAVGCPGVEAVTQSLKTLADRLAPARDWDVFVTETTAAVAEVLSDDATLRRLRATAEQRRRQAYTALRDWLRSVEFRRLGITLASLAGSQVWTAALGPAQHETLNLPLDAFVSRALSRRLHRLTAAGKAIEQHHADALHAIRLRAKRMRYAAEVFAPLYPGKPTRRFLRRLTTLQDRLGRMNDSTVAETLLAKLGTTAGPRAHAAGLVRGFLAARGNTARSQIARAWTRFHRLEPFWT
jgi:CHAD domain-containing protein